MSHRRYWMLGLLLLCLPPVAWAEQLSIHVRQESLVHGSRITLGDVADVVGDDASTVAKVRGIVIGQAPSAGEERRLHGGYIATRLKQHGFDSQQWDLKVPVKFRVTRASQHLEAQEIEAAVKRAITQQMPWQPELTTFRDIRGIESVVLPPGNPTYEVNFSGRTNFLGSTSFSLLLRVDGNVEKRMHGTAYIEVLHDIVTVVRPMAKHEVITEADVRLSQVKLSRPLRQVMTRIEDAIGKRVKRPLRANGRLRIYEVEADPVVRKGDVVLLLVESAQLKISTMGEALEHGERGATIRVRNTASKREVRAVVIDSKTVRVPF